MEALFGSLKGLQSCLTIRASINIFFWRSIHLKPINTRQDIIYFSLKNCSLHSLRNTETSSQRLPVDSSPSPLHHPGLTCKPEEPFNYRRSPRSSGPLFSSEHSNPIFGFKTKSWPHNIDFHIKYRIWSLKLHQYATTSSSWVEVGSTSQTPEMIRS